ncbi:hypothetical protein ILUMI_02271 [Ignelater luminosus]|uniref:ATPase AAA-type core domain-containing protein n=1 Tax=Ignelater luminosus TaxID=2038154 RepID=A0A8K0DP37_IGNLU|nr:hypothetical protein ILUMI_02271 [Ignelater luminosus]
MDWRSRRKLMELFNKAAKHWPSIIFSDELDGLVLPCSQENDQIHCSVVTTVLALMDGLSNTPDVVVIGATNRVAIDSALRQQRVVFSSSCTSARKEILQKFLGAIIDFSKVGGLNNHIRLLREIIVLPLIYADLYFHFNIKAPRGVLFYGSSVTGKTLVASVLDGLSNTPGVVVIGATNRVNAIDSALRRQRVIFSSNICKERDFTKFLGVYASKQELNMHLVPALLQALEHLPIEVADVNAMVEKIILIQHNSASVFLISFTQTSAIIFLKNLRTYGVKKEHSLVASSLNCICQKPSFFI